MIRIYNKKLYDDYNNEYIYPYYYPTVLAKGASNLNDFYFPTPYMNYIYWDFIDFSKSINSAAYKDSVYINQGDTVQYQIKY
jgi:hypothetical protein